MDVVRHALGACRTRACRTTWNQIRGHFALKAVCYNPITFANMSNRDEAAAGPSTSAEQDFIPSESFDGAKPGYVFKLDDCGVGYYRDIPLAERIQAASAEASKAAKSKPVVVKANNSLLKSLQKRGGGPQLSIPSGVKKQKKGAVDSHALLDAVYSNSTRCRQSFGTSIPFTASWLPRLNLVGPC